MNITQIINELTCLESVTDIYSSSPLEQYTSYQVYLNEEKLIEDEKFLYEVHNTLTKYNITPFLYTSENSTYWEFVI